MKEQIVGNHVIYGDWDDTGGSQFMVHWHPNGLNCTIFVFDGFDYGEGIVAVGESMDSDEVEELLDQEFDYDFEYRRAILELVEKHNRRKEVT